MISSVGDWPEVTLANLGGHVTSGSRGWASRYADHGSLFVRITNMRRDRVTLDLRKVRYVLVDPADPEARRTRLESGDILISITADIGIVAFIDEEVPSPAYINQHIARVRLDPRLADGRFVAHYLSSWKPQRRFIGSTDTGAKAGINLPTVNSLTTALPPLSVQRRISAALTDCERQVAAFERLIVKRNAIKQGMMQDLLTGRIRLVRYSSVWREAPLSDVSTMNGRIGWQGLHQGEFTSDARQPFLITGMNFKDGAIDWSEVYHVPLDRYEVAPEIQLRPNDVLMTKDGTIGKMLYIDQIPNPGTATLNSHLLLFRPKHSAYIPKFLYYQLSSSRFARHVDRHKSGSTFFGISQESVGKYLVLLPSQEEQTAIATVLGDLDNEIEVLQLRLKKARAIKRGMMQELLTGRSRLPDMEATR